VGRRRLGARAEHDLHGVGQVFHGVEDVEHSGRLRNHIGGQVPNPFAAVGEHRHGRRRRAEPVGFATHALGEEVASPIT